MSRVFIYPYKSASKSAALLAKEMEVSRLKLVGSKIVDSEDLIIINWGSSNIPYRRAKVINSRLAVNTAANKLSFFKKMAETKGINIPRFTTEYTTALDWVKDGFDVCSRAVVDGNEGRGLFITNKIDDLPKGSPLYTRYLPKSAEYRVYVVDGHAVRAQRKVYPSAKIKAGEKPDWKIRNEANGFLFVVADLKEIPSSQIFQQAILATQAAGLNFGGVDVAWNATAKMASVLEVNTAPGIEGQTATIVANSLKDYIRSIDT
jgi:glutathione synthase/RimK-type ligase-like ATP-grasp enzyme